MLQYTDCPLSGGAAKTLFATAGFEGQSEVGGNYLYYVEPRCDGSQKALLWRRRFDGSDAPVVLAQLGRSDAEAMHVNGGYVYWTEGAGELYRVPR